MKQIIARFNSKCSQTGMIIKKGDSMYYDYDSRKAYHINSPKANEIYESKCVRDYVEAQEDAMFDRFCLNNYL